jgi:basic membrane protein A and related proteins
MTAATMKVATCRAKSPPRCRRLGSSRYIVPFPIPPVIANINAMMLGAQSVRPDIKVKIIWVNTWFDPGKEADAAKALVDQGADILTQHTDSPAPTQIAEQRGIHSFGEDTDMIRFGPQAQLTALTDYWGGYYTKRTQAVLDGTWKSEDTFGGLMREWWRCRPIQTCRMT